MSHENKHVNISSYHYIFWTIPQDAKLVASRNIDDPTSNAATDPELDKQPINEEKNNFEYKSDSPQSIARDSLTMKSINIIEKEETLTRTSFGSTLSINERFDEIEKKLNDFSRVCGNLERIVQRLEAKDKAHEDSSNLMI